MEELYICTISLYLLGLGFCSNLQVLKFNMDSLRVHGALFFCLNEVILLTSVH